MGRTRHTVISIFLSILLLLGGSLGYMLIEKWCFLDAFYMTTITLATVGFSEIHQVSDIGRIFTVILIFLGVGLFLYVAGNTIQILVEGRIREVLGRRKLDKQISRLKNHYIICGYGRIGRVLTRFLTQKYLDVVVIDKNPEHTKTLNDDGVLYLIGEAANESLLKKAGVDRAKALIAAVGSDPDNVFLVLIAKQLNPGLFVVARATESIAKTTLKAAGANKVISPYEVGARRMAHAILRPTVIKFLEHAFADDQTDIQVEEITLSEKSRLVGTPLMESGIRKNLDLIIIAIRKPDGVMQFNPQADTALEALDTLVAVGTAQNLLKLEELLHS